LNFKAVFFVPVLVTGQATKNRTKNLVRVPSHLLKRMRSTALYGTDGYASGGWISRSKEASTKQRGRCTGDEKSGEEPYRTGETICQTPIFVASPPTKRFTDRHPQSGALRVSAT